MEPSARAPATSRLAAERGGGEDRTEMTRRRPSSTSFSFLLSRSFFICVRLRTRDEELVRRPRVACAASMVNSLAAAKRAVSFRKQVNSTRVLALEASLGRQVHVPVSMRPEILDIDSMQGGTCAQLLEKRVGSRTVVRRRGWGGGCGGVVDRYRPVCRVSWLPPLFLSGS